MSSFVPPAQSRRVHTDARNPPLAGFLNQIADAALVAVIFVVPCLLGGVLPSAQLLLGVLALIAAAAWLLGQVFSRDSAWNWLGVEPLIVLGIALLILQITPLPLEWRDRLSPELARLVRPTSDPAAIGPPPWQTLSVIPAATRHALANLVAYALLFLVAAQRVRSAADARRLLAWAAVAPCAMAAFGLVQFLFSNGKFFWCLTVPYVDAADVVHGSFVNRNHLAQFLALGIGPLLILALAPHRPSDAHRQRLAVRRRTGPLGDRTALPQLAAWCGLALVLAAIALSMSRGGMIAAGAALIACLCVCQRSRLLDDRFLVGAFVLGAALVAALFLPGARQLETRITEEVASLDLEKIDAGSARRKVWQAVAHGIQAFPIVGAGVGSHRYVYPLYFDHVDDGTEYTTAENGYLQVGLEAGGAGLALLLIGIGFAALRMVLAAAASRNPQKTACLAAALASIAATAVHAVVETHWFMPGCMALLAPLAGCGLGLSSPDATGEQVRTWRMPRIIWAGGLAGLGWCASAALPVHLRSLQNSEHWTRLAAVASASSAEDDDDALPPPLSRRELDALSDLDSTLPATHLELAKLHLQTFESRQRNAENPMSLGELRQACTSAEFSSAAERRDWLLRATAGNAELLIRARDHVRRCLENCPFEGRAYLYAADLCFIDGGNADTQQALIADARRLRPYHAQVDFAAGQLAWQSGRLDEALVHWRKSYDRSPTWQKTIARLLINYMPAAEFLNTFEPDWHTLRELQHQMALAGHAEYPLVARQFADASVARAHEVLDGSEEMLLREALSIYRRLDDQAAVAACALQAVRFAPGSYDAHAAAGRALQALGRNDEALTHLRWCLQRKPNDQPLSDLFRAVMDRASRDEAIALTDFAAEEPSSAPAEIEKNPFDVSHSGTDGSDSSRDGAGLRAVSTPLNVGPIKERNR